MKAAPVTTLFRTLTSAALLAFTGLAAAQPYADDFAVFVDLPTGFAFVHVPGPGWTFVRQLDAQQLTRLHPSTLTRALAPAPQAVFVDRATGFTFERLPSGWRFAGERTSQAPERLVSSALR